MKRWPRQARWEALGRYVWKGVSFGPEGCSRLPGAWHKSHAGGTAPTGLGVPVLLEWVGLEVGCWCAEAPGAKGSRGFVTQQALHITLA